MPDDLSDMFDEFEEALAAHFNDDRPSMGDYHGFCHQPKPKKIKNLDVPRAEAMPRQTKIDYKMLLILIAVSLVSFGVGLSMHG